MGKLKNLASIKTANGTSFAYTPPESAYGALRTLLKIDADNIRVETLGAVLRGLRRVNPLGRLVIVDRFASREAFLETGILELMDDEMRATTITNLVMQNYRNISPDPQRYLTLAAPTYFEEYECVISISGVSSAGASLVNLKNAFVEGRIKETDESERIEIEEVAEVADVFFTIGQYAHGAVVDLGESIDKVVWGDDILAVDETACRLKGEPIPDYISTIRQMKKQISS